MQIDGSGVVRKLWRLIVKYIDEITGAMLVSSITLPWMIVMIVATNWDARIPALPPSPTEGEFISNRVMIIFDKEIDGVKIWKTVK